LIAGKSELQNFAHAMKRDWDERALKDAKWFINSLKQQQSEEEFDRTGVVEIERLVLADLPLLTGGREPKDLAVLEIGCGAGRMTKHLAAIFGEVAGVDVSGEMIGQARRRLAGINNVRLYETNGVDFSLFADEQFDLILSAYVFQHVPSAAVIESNIHEAWRVLKPGGVFKFQTNSVTSPAFEQAEKDTWAGATLSESEIRGFARWAGAQLVSIFGAGTQYCWTTVRKRAPQVSTDSKPAQPRIEFFGRTVDALNKQIPTEGDQASLTIIASEVDRNVADCNRVSVAIDDLTVAARYVGPVGRNFEGALKAEFGDWLDHLTQIEIGVPRGIQTGLAKVRLRTGAGALSDPLEIEFIASRPVPKLGTIMNAHDHGADIHARGEKSRLKILLAGLDENAGVEPVSVLIGERIIKPDHVSFHPGNAIYEVSVQLPADITLGAMELRVRLGDLQSPPATIHIEDY
jgi:ubiquinone/menaquinone biosynthesis C-methylase UbiE